MRRSLNLILILFCGLTSGRAADTLFFEEEVLPLLQSRCYECHSHESKIKGGLSLDSRSGWVTGGDSGTALVPGDPDKSHLITAVRYLDPEMEMPPRGKLSAEEIAIFEKWVATGAPDPRVGESRESAATGIDLEKGREFWAFRPVGESPPPAVVDSAWPLDPLDHFILTKLESSGIGPVPDVGPHGWLRRVSLDLTGLPPTPEEIAAFLDDRSAHARERVVDRLLASPAFGERWARHWLDLTGYADQIGTSNNVFAEHAWRYRDYVIGAFNRDKPFDRFVREQIAGDLLPHGSPEERAENLIATGFLVLGDIEIVAVDKVKMEVDLVDQQVSKVGGAFLGMTLGCVRCHDHKFDPIGLIDYYGIAGMFRSTDSTHKINNGVWSSVNVVDLPETPSRLAERTRRFTEAEAKRKGLEVRREAAVKEKATLDSRIAEASAETKAALEQQRAGLDGIIKSLNGEIEHATFFAPTEPKAFAVRDRADPDDMRITIRGNPHALGESVKRGPLRVASWSEFPAIPEGESGRRQLADWIADPRNPLTARVAVNRIWQKLFGEGLVRSVDYFGTRGEMPTHPELLDHLAARFVREGWSQKRLIRSLVLSRAYGLGSDHPKFADTDPRAGDPGNRLLWRMNWQRLDAETIRDSMLVIGGTLVVSSGGAALPLEYPENVSSLGPGAVNPPAFALKKWRPVQEFERTVYLPVIRSSGQPGPAKLRDVFDFTQPAQMAGRRSETAVPTQALFLLNSDLLRARAGETARRTLAEGADPIVRIERMWLRVLGRPVTAEERGEALAFVNSLPAESAWTELGHSLLSSNEFLLRP